MDHNVVKSQKPSTIPHASSGFIERLKSKQRLFKSIHFKIAIGYVLVSTVAISSFYFAKKDVNKNRLVNMKVKEEIKKAETGLSDRFKRMNEKNAKFEELQKLSSKQ